MSLQLLNIIIASKLIFYILIAGWLFFIFKQHKPVSYVYITTAALIFFYLVLSYPLEKMFWGNNGDEIFVSAFLNKVLQGNLWSDFYYSWLPVFYSPLYFWVTGIISRIAASNGIVASKIGVMGTFIVWFAGLYCWLKLYWEKIDNRDDKDTIFQARWYWFLFPIVYFISLDFDTIITKPYEAAAALFGVMWMGLVVRKLENKWNIREYLWFGISGGLLFLCFYFWWFIFIPVLIYFILVSKNKVDAFKKIILIGIIIFVISSPYLIPLLISFGKYGIENWQAIFFVPEYVNSFVPWTETSIRSILFILGIFGLLLARKNKIVRANLIIFIFCYIYQFLNLLIALGNGRPVIANKPFLFLGSASLMVGAVYIIIWAYRKYLEKQDDLIRNSIIIVLILLFSPLLPMGNFIESKIVQYNLEQDLKAPVIKKTAVEIENKLPDYKNYTWLTSGTPDLNAYLDITYYIAHNPHFSHQAANYSKRRQHIKKMVAAESGNEFYGLTQLANPPITALLLYSDENSEMYNLYFWADSYPDGGKEKILTFDKKLINKNQWQRIDLSGGWEIFIKK